PWLALGPLRLLGLGRRRGRGVALRRLGPLGLGGVLLGLLLRMAVAGPGRGCLAARGLLLRPGDLPLGAAA
ncbi:hypothetical protein, partial [Streptomyces sp. NRRL S-481]|uniref:hypothetical protein n=1 Tax=Streptomyces sp. NRRL S-481 TaxID=1463911 RepID=UPI0004C661EA